MKDKIKRTKRIEIRLSSDEYLALQERKTKARLAEWLRELALEQQPKKKPRPTDPKLLFQLNRIGVNINQIAKNCNRNTSSIDLISISATLQNIEQSLSEILGESKK